MIVHKSVRTVTECISLNAKIIREVLFLWRMCPGKCFAQRKMLMQKFSSSNESTGGKVCQKFELICFGKSWACSKWGLCIYMWHFFVCLFVCLMAKKNISDKFHILKAHCSLFLALRTLASWFLRCCWRFDSWMKALPQFGRWHRYGRSSVKDFSNYFTNCVLWRELIGRTLLSGHWSSERSDLHYAAALHTLGLKSLLFCYGAQKKKMRRGQDANCCFAIQGRCVVDVYYIIYYMCFIWN